MFALWLIYGIGFYISIVNSIESLMKEKRKLKLPKEINYKEVVHIFIVSCFSWIGIYGLYIGYRIIPSVQS